MWFILFSFAFHAFYLQFSWSIFQIWNLEQRISVEHLLQTVWARWIGVSFYALNSPGWNFGLDLRWVSVMIHARTLLLQSSWNSAFVINWYIITGWPYTFLANLQKSIMLTHKVLFWNISCGLGFQGCLTLKLEVFLHLKLACPGTTCASEVFCSPYRIV